MIYKKGDLFSHNGVNSILVHACNCRGSWGAGIAKQFLKKYPDIHESYWRDCAMWGNALAGRCLLYPKESQVGCLFTSAYYGILKDSESKILENTFSAIRHLDTCLGYEKRSDVTICSPKINAGLFGVPWEKTEEVIEKALCQTKNIKEWIVYEL